MQLNREDSLELLNYAIVAREAQEMEDGTGCSAMLHSWHKARAHLDARGTLVCQGGDIAYPYVSGEGPCGVCGEVAKLKYLPICTRDSEGTPICEYCEWAIMGYLIALQNLSARARKAGYISGRDTERRVHGTLRP